MTLWQIIIKKEKKHWKRMFMFMSKFKQVGKFFGFKLVLILIVIHYAYVFMSTAYEGYLYVVNKSKFKENLHKLSLSI